MSETCERDECDKPGRVYYQLGRTVSSGPINWSSSGPAPEQIRLCSEHAVRDLGVGFGINR